MALMTMVTSSRDGCAGWFLPHEQTPWEKSGLDLKTGYDINTEIVVEGVVENFSSPNDDGPFVIALRSGEHLYYLVVGPHWFWDRLGVTLAPGDYWKATGSKAQGSDGNLYLLVKSFKAATSDNEVSLRDEHGTPCWSRRQYRSSARRGDSSSQPGSNSTRFFSRQGFGRQGR
jgi:hypothetical protein